MANNPQGSNQIASITIDIKIIQGRNLIAMDKNPITRKKTSDPFVQLYYKGIKYGQTQVMTKTLSPIWNRGFTIKIGTDEVMPALQGDPAFRDLSLRIFDKDKFSDDDFMGEAIVSLPFTEPWSESRKSWYPVGTGTGQLKCKKAKGDIEIEVLISAKKVANMVRGNTYPLNCKLIRVSLQWAIEAGEKTDLDTSCVAIDEHGNILMDETVYFGDLTNSNKSIQHSGDALEGGKGEVIDCNLRNISRAVRALYFIVTVATPDKTLRNVKNASVRVMDTTSKTLLCQFLPGLGEEHTAMFLMRVTRNRDDWTMTIIEDMDHTARDFGSLIPEIKGYSRDICPSVVVNPRERVAVMRKGGAIRIKDYSNGASFDQDIVFGLAWDITDGKNIDLDASAICLDSDLNVNDIIYFKKLCSYCGSIRHSGDERTGKTEGDDEQIIVKLNGIQPAVMYVAFVVNSYSGEELDDVTKAKCHLLNPHTRMDLAQYQISNDSSLDKHTGLLMTCLYRNSDEWYLRVLGKAGHGKRACDLVSDLQNYLRNEPTPEPAIVPEPDIIVNAMPASCPLQEEEVVVNPFFPTGNTPFVPVLQPIRGAPSVSVPIVP